MNTLNLPFEMEYLHIIKITTHNLFSLNKNNFTMENPGRLQIKSLFIFILYLLTFLSVLNLLDAFSPLSFLWNHFHQGQHDLHKIKSNGQFSVMSSDLSGAYYKTDCSPILKPLWKMASPLPFSSGSPDTTQTALPYCLLQDSLFFPSVKCCNAPRFFPEFSLPLHL